MYDLIVLKLFVLSLKCEYFCGLFVETWHDGICIFVYFYSFHGVNDANGERGEN